MSSVAAGAAVLAVAVVAWWVWRRFRAAGWGRRPPGPTPDGLRDDARRFQALFEQAVTGMVIVGPDGRLVRANPAFCEMLGYTEQELVGRTSYELAHPDDHDASRLLVTALVEGTIASCRTERRYLHRDGSTVHTETSISVLRGPDGQVDCYVAHIIDISERMALETELRRHTAQLESSRAELIRRQRFTDALLDTIDVAIVGIDAKGRPTYFNRRLKQLVGGDPASTGFDSHFAEHVRLVDAHGVTELDSDRSPFRRTLTEGQLSNERMVLEVGDTRRHLIIHGRALRGPDGTLLGGFVAGHDVTDLVEGHQALAESEERFRGVFDHAVIGMNLVDPHGLLIAVNRAFCELVGRDATELLGRPLTDLVHPADRVDFGRRLSEALVGDRPSYRTERRYLHADGHVIHADVAAVLVRDADGRPMHLACQVLDITERKRLEAQVEAERDLSDRLVASLSERGALTTDPEPVAAEAVVTDVLDGLTGTVPGLRAGELTDAAVLVDRGQLRQVLVNLVTNAARHGAPPVEVSAHAGNDWVELRVRDHGPGVPAEFVPHLFDRFTRASVEAPGTPPGTGLGLFIVQRLVEANRGRIWYEPAEGGGACFVVRLPQPSATGERVPVRDG